MSGQQLAPSCPRCHSRHLVDLKCWRGRYAQRVVRAVLATQGTVCWLCGHAGADSADHVTPRVYGGTDHPDNLRPCHARPCPTCQVACNAARQHRAPFTPDPEPTPTGVGLSPRWRP